MFAFALKPTLSSFVILFLGPVIYNFFFSPSLETTSLKRVLMNGKKKIISFNKVKWPQKVIEWND